MVIKSIRRHYAAVQRRSDIGGAHLWALSQVARKPGGSVGDVARALAVHPSTASNLIRRLAAQGMVEAQRKGKDKRSVQLYTSRTGLAALRRAPRPVIGVLQQALADLSAPSVEALHRSLEELISVMKVKDVRARVELISQM
jgi:DNA-binding MarR family transcriptional regulator